MSIFESEQQPSLSGRKKIHADYQEIRNGGIFHYNINTNGELVFKESLNHQNTRYPRKVFDLVAAFFQAAGVEVETNIEIID